MLGVREAPDGRQLLHVVVPLACDEYDDQVWAALVQPGAAYAFACSMRGGGCLLCFYSTWKWADRGRRRSREA